MLQVSNWGFTLADLKMQKKQRGRGVLNLLKSLLNRDQEEYTGFLGPIHMWQVSHIYALRLLLPVFLIKSSYINRQVSTEC